MPDTATKLRDEWQQLFDTLFPEGVVVDVPDTPYVLPVPRLMVIDMQGLIPRVAWLPGGFGDQVTVSPLVTWEKQSDKPVIVRATGSKGEEWRFTNAITDYWKPLVAEAKKDVSQTPEFWRRLNGVPE